MKIAADEMKALKRFRECCEDFDSGGHDLSKPMTNRLEVAGALRSIGFDRHEITEFGDWLLAQPSANQPPAPAVAGSSSPPYHVAEGSGAGINDILVHILKGTRRVATINTHVFPSHSAVRSFAEHIVTELNKAPVATAARPEACVGNSASESLLTAKEKLNNLRNDISSLNSLLSKLTLPCVDDVRDIPLCLRFVEEKLASG